MEAKIEATQYLLSKEIFNFRRFFLDNWNYKASFGLILTKEKLPRYILSSSQVIKICAF